MTETKVGSHTAGVAIPFMSSLVTTIELPDVEQKQLEQMVPLEARKYIPVPISEVLLDWSLVPTESRSAANTAAAAQPTLVGQNSLKKVEVMVVAIHNQTITKFQEITSKAELQASFYEIEMFSSIRAHLESHESGTMVIDFGAGATKLYIIEQGLIQLSHLISRGGQDITMALSKTLEIPFAKAEALKKQTDVSFLTAPKEAAAIIATHIDYIFSEVKHSIEGYEKKYNKTIQKVVLIGGGALMKGLVANAKQKLGVTAVLGDPFSHVEAPEFMQELLKTQNPEFGVAVGLALRMLQEG